MLPSSDAQLLRTRQAFHSWRSSTPGRRRIPDHLWEAAISLLDHFSLARVSRELALNSARLRSHQLSAERNALVAQPAPLFVELPHPIAPSQAKQSDSLTLLFELSDGQRLTLTLPSSAADRIASICSLFLRR